MIYLLEQDKRFMELVDLDTVDLVHSEIKHPLMMDVRYSRQDNFLGRVVYSLPKSFLLKHVTEDLIKVHTMVNAHGFGLLVFDGYRPWSVTKIFWDESSQHDRQFLANPESGSTHNRGCAVDLSLYDLKTGKEVQMPSGFDEMNEKAYTAYPDGSEESRRARDLLQWTMKENGFTGIKNEWWHFNHLTQHSYPVMNFTFEEILQAPKSPIQNLSW